MDLHEKIASMIQLWDADYATSADMADEILAIPEIKDALAAFGDVTISNELAAYFPAGDPNSIGAID